MKRNLTALGLAVFLCACSTTNTTPPSSETVLLPDVVPVPSLSSDPFLDLGAPLDSSASSGGLATPVDLPAPDSAGSSDSFYSEDSFLAQPSPPQPPAPPPPLPDPSPAPYEAAPTAAQATGSAMPPVVSTPGASATGDRNLRQDYEEYQDRVRARSRAESQYDKRALFPHEDGAFQIGLDYAHDAFKQLDFDPGTGEKYLDSMGGVFSVNYFPLRSLSYGRLGVGAQMGAYWTNYSFDLAGGTKSESRRNAINTFGGRILYEFQYFIGQFVVPFAFYGYDQVSIKEYILASAGVSYPARSFGSQYYGGGLHFNLNRLESTAASTALATSGIRKFYLSYTFQQRAENTGAGHFLGLRFEY